MDKQYILNWEEADFINNALNFYWHEANNQLQRKDLGNMERKNYEYQKAKAKELMTKLDAY